MFCFSMLCSVLLCFSVLYFALFQYALFCYALFQCALCLCSVLFCSVPMAAMYKLLQQIEDHPPNRRNKPSCPHDKCVYDLQSLHITVMIGLDAAARPVICIG